MELKRMAVSISLIWVTLFGVMGNAWGERPLTDYPASALEALDKGQKLQNAEKYREALRAYEEAEKLGLAGHPKLALLRAQCHDGLKNRAEAIKYFTGVIEKGMTEGFCRL